MFEDGDVIYAGTCEGHAENDPPYRGGYWIEIDKKSGKVIWKHDLAAEFLL